MADGISVPGIQASFGLDTTQLDSALQKVRAGMDAAADKVRQAQRALDAGTMSATQFAKVVKQAEAETKLLDRAVESLTSQLNSQRSAIAGATSFTVQYTTSMRGMASASEMVMSRTGALGRALMQVGYIADDVQYGFQGIVNNIAPLAMNIGLAFGATGPQAQAAAAGVQVFAVAAYQAYQHWDELMDVMGTGRVLTEAEEMEKLAKATKLTADEALRLRGYKAVQSEIKAQENARPEAEEKATKKFREALAEGDYEKIKKGLIETSRGMLTNRPEAQAKQEEINRLKDQLSRADNLNPNYIPSSIGEQKALEERQKTLKQDLKDRIAKAEEELQNDINEAARQYLGEAGRNESGRRQEFMNIMRRNPGAFGPHGAAVLDKLEKSTPEAIKKAEEDKRFKKAEKWLDARTKHDEAELDRQDEEVKRQRRENLKAAKDAIPGVEKRTQGRIRESGDQTQALTKELMGLGFSEDDAKQAAHDLNHEASNKVTAENQDPEYQRRQRNRARQRGLEAVPGIDRMAREMELQGLARGMAPQALYGLAFTKVRTALEKAGLKGDELNEATKGVLGKADADLKKEVMGKSLEEREKARHSEVFDASEINRRVQQSVGGDPHKKAEGQRDQMIKYLATMAQANGEVLKLDIDQ